MAWRDVQQQYHQRINQLLQQQIEALPPHPSQLKSAMAYALLTGGKRIRPFLIYATGEMLNARQQDLDACAMALECMHAYSLLHDDLPAMDDDDLRRGHPTCHIAFDEATAILAGDALQCLAFEILTNHSMTSYGDSQRLALVRCLSAAAGYQGMCGGQAMDLAATDQKISLAELEQLHQLKTGALIRSALTMAVLVSPDASDADMQGLQSYAGAIGLAFQIQDDILDITSNTAILGKPQGSDQSANKSTYPALLGLQGAQQLLQQILQQGLQDLQSLPYNTEVLQSFADYIVSRTN